MIIRRMRRLLPVVSWIAAWLTVWGLVERPAAAWEPAQEEEQRSAVAADETNDVAGRPSRDQQSRTRALSLGFVLLGCIIVGGALLLTLIVTWGNRTRRLAQSPLPPVSERDELWFLKPKKALPESDSDAPNLARSDPPQGE